MDSNHSRKVLKQKDNTFNLNETKKMAVGYNLA